MYFSCSTIVWTSAFTLLLISTTSPTALAKHSLRKAHKTNATATSDRTLRSFDPSSEQASNKQDDEETPVIALDEQDFMLLPPEFEDGFVASEQEDFEPDMLNTFDVEFAPEDEEDEDDSLKEDHHGNRKLASYNSQELKMAQYVQYERTRRGYQPVRWSADLLDEAQRWANHMARMSRLSHRKPLSQGINGYRLLAENVAYHWSVGYSGAHTSLMNSPGHRKNILNPRINPIGVGIRRASNGYYYVCEIYKQI